MIKIVGNNIQYTNYGKYYTITGNIITLHNIDIIIYYKVYYNNTI